MKNKLAVVTGGTHGIGRACVLKLCKDGYHVLFSGRDSQAGKEVCAKHPNAIYRQCDVTNEQNCIDLIEQALELGDGRINGLINNAGTSLRSPFHETQLPDWDRIMSVNVRSVYHITRLCIEGLIAAKGNVVTTSSVAGLVGQKDLALYTASKAALIGLTQALALEYGESVRFNAVCPGQIGTRMMQPVIEDSDRLAAIVSTIPVKRLGTPEEVSELITWLLSDTSSFVNGAIVPIDGGETAGIFD